MLVKILRTNCSIKNKLLLCNFRPSRLCCCDHFPAVASSFQPDGNVTDSDCVVCSRLLTEPQAKPRSAEMVEEVVEGSLGL